MPRHPHTTHRQGRHNRNPHDRHKRDHPQRPSPFITRFLYHDNPLPSEPDITTPTASAPLPGAAHLLISRSDVPPVPRHPHNTAPTAKTHMTPMNATNHNAPLHHPLSS
ncbi:hypothetical protein GCM10022214_53750 [Actinomadura miaoliensis]|uniref:Uncharacterized protein n=1 Tax=Actinomadura miaoliensis TaxID=430685 RepID=A0ABP7WDN3_9ACTN